MTDAKTALLELAEQEADADLVREMLAFAAERMMGPTLKRPKFMALPQGAELHSVRLLPSEHSESRPTSTRRLTNIRKHYALRGGSISIVYAGRPYLTS